MRKRYERIAPRPEELAAFLDGELDPALRVQVEEWLGDHPETAAELEELRRLGRMVQATAADAPEEAAWSAVLDRIEAAAQTQPVPAWRRVVLAGTAAAALFLAFLNYRPADQPSAAPGEPAEPLVLASHDDIEIISMNGGDTDALIVGHPPLREPLVLASAEDISVDRVEPDSSSGMMPSVRWWAGIDAPMIVASTLPPEKGDE